MSNVIVCPNCGQKNRVNKESDKHQAICAKCGTKLDVLKKPYTPPPRTGKIKSSGHRYGWAWLLVMVVVVGVYLWWGGVQDSNNFSSSESLDAYSDLKQAQSYPEVVMPYNGSTQIYTNSERVAPFEIQTSSGANYLVKLVTAYSHESAMTIFIKGGNTISVNVPLGTYEVKYASGEKWYGYEHYFGQETDYSKAEKLFTFENTGDHISGYTMTLYRVPNGNLRTTKINPSQF
jgi:transcription initiation factor TFIIIB Brf1 subunit/transcription initiation factor TFIIB